MMTQDIIKIDPHTLTVKLFRGITLRFHSDSTPKY